MSTERSTKGVYTHITEIPWEEIEERGGLFGRRNKATLSRFSSSFIVSPPPEEILTVWQTRPGEVQSSTEYIPTGHNHGVYPKNLNLYEIALCPSQDVEPPPQFLKRQGRKVKKEDLRLLPKGRCVAAIPLKPLAQALEQEISEDNTISEERITATISRSLKEQKGIKLTPGISRQQVAKTLGQLWVENQIAYAVKYTRDIDQLKERLASAELSSDYLRKYRRMLIE